MLSASNLSSHNYIVLGREEWNDFDFFFESQIAMRENRTKGIQTKHWMCDDEILTLMNKTDVLSGTFFFNN